MYPSNLWCLQCEHIKRTFITVWTDQTYTDYMNSPNVYFLDYVHIKFTLFTVCTIKPTLLKVWTHRHYVAYSMVPLSLSCLHHGFIKHTLFAL